MTRRSNSRPKDGGGARAPRLQDWQRDRVFRHNRGWVPVKRCASCGRTCHYEQHGEWADETWYCGLHCLRDGLLGGQTFLDRRVDQQQQRQQTEVDMKRPTGPAASAEPIAIPARPREKIDWADDVDDPGTAALCFGDFPPIS